VLLVFVDKLRSLGIGDTLLKFLSILEDLLRHYKERFLNRENYLLPCEERTLKVYL
jgi:hypothetical protein